MPILLDLFSGSLSWSRAFSELDWECISVDNDSKLPGTTIVCDMLKWKVPERLRGVVDVVTIGTPCTAYSVANKKKTEKAQEMTRELWRRAFAIVDFVLKPGGVCVCENPSRTELTGIGSDPGDMERIRAGMYKVEVNYCRYSESDLIFPWKLTTLWSNRSQSTRL